MDLPSVDQLKGLSCLRENSFPSQLSNASRNKAFPHLVEFLPLKDLMPLCSSPPSLPPKTAASLLRGEIFKTRAGTCVPCSATDLPGLSASHFTSLSCYFLSHPSPSLSVWEFKTENDPFSCGVQSPVVQAVTC